MLTSTSTKNNTHFDFILFGNRQFRERDGVVINENAYIVIDATSFDDMIRLSQVRVENLQQRSILFVTEKYYS